MWSFDFDSLGSRGISTIHFTALDYSVIVNIPLQCSAFPVALFLLSSTSEPEIPSVGVCSLEDKKQVSKMNTMGNHSNSDISLSDFYTLLYRKGAIQKKKPLLNQIAKPKTNGAKVSICKQTQNSQPSTYPA